MLVALQGESYRKDYGKKRCQSLYKGNLTVKTMEGRGVSRLTDTNDRSSGK